MATNQTFTLTSRVPKHGHDPKRHLYHEAGDDDMDSSTPMPDKEKAEHGNNFRPFRALKKRQRTRQRGEWHEDV